MRVGIVNDLELAVQVLRRALALSPGYEIAWIARNGQEAVDLCQVDRPDVLLMDLLMPVMNGVEATLRIMQSTPCPILIVTSDIGAHVPLVYQAMGHGALDAVDTPSFAGGDLAKTAAALHQKIGLILSRSLPRADNAPSAPQRRAAEPHAQRLLAVGASAGGPVALVTLLAGLPVNFSGAVVIVQHVDAAFAPGMAEWLGQQQDRIPVRVAREGDSPLPGIALMAATNDHLRLDVMSSLRYSAEPVESFYRPSVDAFFGDVAEHWRGQAVGVILTGMGRDGAVGLKAMRQRGFHTVAQDRATSAVYGMPKAAAELGAAVDILPLNSIARSLLQYF